MRIIGIALSITTLNDKGGRIEFAASVIEAHPANVLDGQENIPSVVGTAATAPSEGWTELVNLTRDATIVVLDKPVWMRALRVARQNRWIDSTARKALSSPVSLREWARGRFPRKRKDLAALARLLGVRHQGALSGASMRDQARLIAELGRFALADANPQRSAKDPVDEKTGIEEAHPVTAAERPWRRRALRCWRGLIWRPADLPKDER